MGQRKENPAMENIAALFSRIEKLEAEKVELTHIIENYQEKDRGRVDTVAPTQWIATASVKALFCFYPHLRR